MAGQLRFSWNKGPTSARMHNAAHRTLERLKEDAYKWWLVVVPVLTGQLRDSWFAYIIDTETGIVLIFGAATKYAIYVELGTGLMPPRAPIRTTAGEIVPLIPYYLREELAG